MLFKRGLLAKFGRFGWQAPQKDPPVHRSSVGAKVEESILREMLFEKGILDSFHQTFL